MAGVLGAMFSRVKLAHIQLPAEPIAGIDTFPITNTMLTGWIAALVVIFLFWRGTTAMKMVALRSSERVSTCGVMLPPPGP